MIVAERKLYDVEPQWSPERKEAFGLYRDFGPSRSLRAVGEVLGKSSELIERWSSEDGWRLRVAQWDADQDRIAQEAQQEERARIAKKHARAIESTITVLMQPAIKLADQIERGDLGMLEDADPIMLANLTAQAGKQIPALVQASRLVHGFSTSNVAVTAEHRVKIEGASPEELDSYLLGYDDGVSSAIDDEQKTIEAASD